MQFLLFTYCRPLRVFFNIPTGDLDEVPLPISTTNPPQKQQASSDSDNFYFQLKQANREIDGERTKGEDKN
jgi:hypothetical protein